MHCCCGTPRPGKPGANPPVSSWEPVWTVHLESSSSRELKQSAKLSAWEGAQNNLSGEHWWQVSPSAHQEGVPPPCMGAG